jgi:elongation factor Ts
MGIPTAQVKQLREMTGAGILDCRRALEETGGDLDRAVQFLREKGLAAAEKRLGRETREGFIDLYSHGNGRVGVMVEANCETDFVARTEEFRRFVHEVSLQVAAACPLYLDASEIPAEVVEVKRAEARNQARHEGKPERVWDQIVEGRLDKFYQEVCLLRQPYIRDEQVTVADVLRKMIASTGENVVIRRFQRWEVGQEAV